MQKTMHCWEKWIRVENESSGSAPCVICKKLCAHAPAPFTGSIPSSESTEEQNTFIQDLKRWFLCRPAPVCSDDGICIRALIQRWRCMILSCKRWIIVRFSFASATQWCSLMLSTLKWTVAINVTNWLVLVRLNYCLLKQARLGWRKWQCTLMRAS